MICLACANTDPAAVTCNSALGGKSTEHLCARRVAVEGDVATAVGEVRVPDSAREGAA